MMKNTAKRIFAGLSAAALSLLPAAQALADTTMNGAGATFPFPLYSKWFDEYNKTHPDVRINYQSIGSGGGIRQFTAHTVDFGASDGPMTDQQIAAVSGPVVHIPTVLGAVVPIYHVDGVADLKFTGAVLANIYLGKIQKWDDPAIKAINPGVALPDERIIVVHRADGSGTTYCVTDYLSAVSPQWKSSVGKSTSVNWPVGLGGKGNEGVAGLVKQMKNSLGYTELIYALQNNLGYGSVQNKAGRYVKATVESVSAAAAGAAGTMPKDYRVSIVNAPGHTSYPISTFTWLLVSRNMGGEKGKVMKDFLNWMLDKGQALAPSLGYAPLPDAVKKLVRQTIQSIQ